MEILDEINKQYVDQSGRPLINITIKDTLIIEDPFPDIEGMQIPSEIT